MKEIIIRIKNRKGKILVASVNLPNQNKKLPAILVQHGFKGFRKQRHIARIALSIAKRGIITIRPDLTNNPGGSYLEFANLTYSQEILDLEDVFNYLLTLPQVDPLRVGLTGHSLGGILVAELTSKRKEVKSLALLSAVYNFSWIAKRIFEKPFSEVKRDFETQGWTKVWSKTLQKSLLIKKEFYEDVFFRTADDFAHKITCPTLIVSGQNDESVSQQSADSYFKKIGSKIKQMKIIKNADHNYSGDSLKSVENLVTDWFVETLKL